MSFEQFCAMTFEAHPILMTLCWPSLTALYALVKADYGWLFICGLYIASTSPTSCTCTHKN